MVDEGRYLAANTVGDVWICYPWEATYVFCFVCYFVRGLTSLLVISTNTIG